MTETKHVLSKFWDLLLEKPAEAIPVIRVGPSKANIFRFGPSVRRSIVPVS